MAYTACDTVRMIMTETLINAIGVGVWMCAAGMAMILWGMRSEDGEDSEPEAARHLQGLLK